MPAVMVAVHDGEVRYLVMHEDGDQIMIDSTRRWQKLGTIAMSSRIKDGLIKRVWEAIDTDGGEYTGDLKEDAINAMADAHGFRIVPSTAAMPDLFDMEEL